MNERREKEINKRGREREREKERKKRKTLSEKSDSLK